MRRFESNRFLTHIKAPKSNFVPVCRREHVVRSQAEKEGFIAAREALYRSLPAVSVLEGQIAELGLKKRECDLRISEIRDRSGMDGSRLNEMDRLRGQIMSIERKLAKLKMERVVNLVDYAITLYEENLALKLKLSEAR